MADRALPLFAVLIDADNVPAKYAGAILKEITSFGEPALRRVYGDWGSSRLGNWAKAVKELGLVAHQESANTTGKNASDIGLVIDAMDILHSARFDGFVLVSSDSDFTALANRVREQGLDVIGIGEAKTPDSLKNVCNRFILLENIDDSSKVNDTTSTGKQSPSAAIPLINRAMEMIDPDGEWYMLGQLGQYLTRENPDFDARSYGEKNLSGLLAKLNTRFESRKDGSHVQVRRRD